MTLLRTLAILWNGARPKIARKILNLPKKQGGLKLVNIMAKDKSVKVTWPKILQSETKLRITVYKNLKNSLKDLLWSCNLRPEGLKAWFELKDLHKKEHCDEILWNNSDIKINGKIVMWDDCFNKGLIYTSQLFDNRGEVISCLQAHRLYNLDIMRLNSLISAMPRRVKRAIKQGVITKKDNFYHIAMGMDNLSAYAYNCYIGKETNVLKNKIEKWNDLLKSNMSIKSYEKHFANLYMVSNSAKHRSFQYRLLQRAILLNETLSKWGIVDSCLCTFCKLEVEDYVHLFVLCPKIQPIWIKIEQFMNTFNNVQINFNVENVIMNTLVDNVKNIKNSICLYFKQYVYRKRCFKEEPKFIEFTAEVLKLQAMEKYIAMSNGNTRKHELKWYNTEHSKKDNENIATYVEEYMTNIEL